MFFVRTATERDLEKVSALLGQTWHATYDSLYGADKVAAITGKWHSVAALRTRLAARGAEFVVADDGKALAGMGYAAMAKDEPHLAVLHQLYVLPDYQGQGIGRDLFAELETCFPDARRLRLEVEPENVKAVRFYEMLGFEKIDETLHCGEVGSGIPALIYEKPLEG